MGAPNSICFFGVCYPMTADEGEEFYPRDDQRVRAARSEGLRWYFENFAEPGEEYILFIGDLLGNLGPENEVAIEIDQPSLTECIAAVRRKLPLIGCTEEPKLYMRWRFDA